MTKFIAPEQFPYETTTGWTYDSGEYAKTMGVAMEIAGYEELNLSEAVAGVKELTDPADIRTIIAYEEAHKNRQRIVSAAQTRVAAIAQEIVGID